ncbi:MAG: hypothetical protein QG589_482 [Patescibacteria group bacterium]|nr:hypothetical protein [Patescibacteria group bacterium]
MPKLELTWCVVKNLLRLFTPSFWVKTDRPLFFVGLIIFGALTDIILMIFIRDYPNKNEVPGN